MALQRNVKCHRNIFRIQLFIREAEKLGLSHRVFPLTQLECVRTSLAQTQRSRGPVDLFTDIYW